tara:strand:- start:3587 stop:3997 length:411 start_codon:yes stop_codon:yes gene_type:complete
MYTEPEQEQEQEMMKQRILGQDSQAKKQKAIAVSLNSFGVNYRKTIDKELIQIWIQSIQHLSLEQIARGTKRCLQEVEFFPSVAKFIELAKGRKESDRWVEPKPDQLLIEEKKERVPMPKEFKELFGNFLNKKSVK